MKKNLSIEEADILLEKYYDGTSTGAEEELLFAFLQQDGLPERFEAERALFGYFANEKKPHFSTNLIHPDIEVTPLKDDLISKEKRPPRHLRVWFQPALKWSLAAAAILSCVLVLDNKLQAQNNNVAYIDGVRCTDTHKIAKLAQASIQQIDLESDEVAGTVNNINDNNLVESQLQQFPDFN